MESSIKKLLVSSFIIINLFFATASKAEEPIVHHGLGYKPNQIDTSINIIFSPPTSYIEVSETAEKNGLYKFYQLPNPNGNPRSFFTVAFQQKNTEKQGLHNLNEFIDVAIYNYKHDLPNSVIAKVNMQGIINEKFNSFKLPYQAFMFKGNLQPNSFTGDSLTLFFETDGGFWSIVWTVPQPAIQQGFPIFEGFINDMTINIISKRKEE